MVAVNAMEAALQYAGRGWRVFPLNGKVPRAGTHGFQDATVDPDVIRGWPSNANVGIATGAGLVVIDVDARHGGGDTLAELEARHGRLPETVSVETGGGGEHLYFRTDAEVRNSAGELGPGLDVRGAGGYAVAPPSVHPSGRRYEWDNDPAEVEVAQLPGWLERLLTERNNGKAPPIGDVIPHGKQHDMLVSLAGSMRRRGAEAPEIAAALKEMNRRRCEWPGTDAEMDKIAESMMRYRPGEPSKSGAAPGGPTPQQSKNGATATAFATGPVDTSTLLDEVKTFISRFVVLPSPAAGDLLALWVLHTHAFDAAWATAYLRIVSAAPDSGKTLLMEVLAAICRRGWHAVNPSVAVLYRRVDRDTPTLLLDEMDNYPVDERRDAMSVLNAGYKRGAQVDRCKENGHLVSFDAFCPKGYAGLDSGALVATLLSRSITLRLERKTASERAEMWIAPLVEPEAAALRERCEAWGAQHVEALAAHRPDLLGLFNRAAEVWWALLAIAEQAGGDWEARARDAAREFASGGDGTDDVPDQVQLLLDIQDAFEDKSVISTEGLLAKLNDLDESPWGSRRKGEGLDARGLARMLRPFKVKPKQVRIGDGTRKGYHVDQFEDAFARHLPEAKQAKQGKHSAPGLERDVSDVSDVSHFETRVHGLVEGDGGLAPPPYADDGLDDMWPDQPYHKFLDEQEGRS